MPWGVNNDSRAEAIEGGVAPLRAGARQVPCVILPEEVVGTLIVGGRDKGAGDSYDNTPVVLQPITFDNRPQVNVAGIVDTITTEGARNPLSVVCATGHVTHTEVHEGADAPKDGTGRGTPIVVASGQANAEIGRGICPSLTLLHEAPIVALNRPRRLTPRECERLMSWPDDWTATGINEKGVSYELSDTARYRLCGNGCGSIITEWIGRRLMEAESSTEVL